MCAEAGGGGGFSNCRSVREIYQSRSQLSMVHPGTSVCFCGGYVRYGGRKLKASQIRLRPSSHFPGLSRSSGSSSFSGFNTVRTCSLNCFVCSNSTCNELILTYMTELHEQYNDEENYIQSVLFPGFRFS